MSHIKATIKLEFDALSDPTPMELKNWVYTYIEELIEDGSLDFEIEIEGQNK